MSHFEKHNRIPYYTLINYNHASTEKHLMMLKINKVCFRSPIQCRGVCVKLHGWPPSRAMLLGKSPYTLLYCTCIGYGTGTQLPCEPTGRSTGCCLLKPCFSSNTQSRSKVDGNEDE